MEGLRSELVEVALRYANKQIDFKAKNPILALKKISEAHVDMAIDEPNLFRFIYMGKAADI